MARLPVVGSDGAAWGGVLNDFLLVAHNADGTLRSSSGGALTPEAFGAVGNGTTDDTAALVSWLAALKAGPIKQGYLTDSAHYLVTAATGLGDLADAVDITITGKGWLDWAVPASPSVDFLRILRGTSITLIGTRLMAHGRGARTANGVLLTIQDSVGVQCNGIEVTGGQANAAQALGDACVGTKVINSKFHDCLGGGFGWYGGANNGSMVGCESYDNGDDAFDSFSGSAVPYSIPHHISWVGCTAHDGKLGAGYSGSGFGLSGHHLTISGCTITGMAAAGIGTYDVGGGGEPYETNNLTIADCTIDNVGLEPTFGASAGLSLYGVRDVTAHGLVIRDVLQGHGVLFGDYAKNVKLHQITYLGTPIAYLLTVTGGAGTFTLTVGANTTAAQAWNVAPATLQSQLAGLASVGAGNVTVNGSTVGTTSRFLIRWAGAKLGAATTITTNGGASGATATLAVSNAGGRGLSAIQNLTTNATIEGRFYTAFGEAIPAGGAGFDNLEVDQCTFANCHREAVRIEGVTGRHATNVRITRNTTYGNNLDAASSVSDIVTNYIDAVTDQPNTIGTPASTGGGTWTPSNATNCTSAVYQRQVMAADITVTTSDTELVRITIPTPGLWAVDAIITWVPGGSTTFGFFYIQDNTALVPIGLITEAHAYAAANGIVTTIHEVYTVPVAGTVLRILAAAGTANLTAKRYPVRGDPFPATLLTATRAGG